MHAFSFRNHGAYYGTIDGGKVVITLEIEDAYFVCKKNA